jgi:hypothetical protein
MRAADGADLREMLRVRFGELAGRSRSPVVISREGKGLNVPASLVVISRWTFPLPRRDLARGQGATRPSKRTLRGKRRGNGQVPPPCGTQPPGCAPAFRGPTTPAFTRVSSGVARMGLVTPAGSLLAMPEHGGAVGSSELDSPHRTAEGKERARARYPHQDVSVLFPSRFIRSAEPQKGAVGPAVSMAARSWDFRKLGATSWPLPGGANRCSGGGGTPSSTLRCPDLLRPQATHAEYRWTSGLFWNSVPLPSPWSSGWRRRRRDWR